MSYSPEERRAIVQEARKTARALLDKLELLASMEEPASVERIPDARDTADAAP